MITLLRYLGGLVFGIDTEAEIANLPTDTVTPNAIALTDVPLKIKPWSLAIIGATGKVAYFNGTAWVKVGQ